MKIYVVFEIDHDTGPSIEKIFMSEEIARNYVLDEYGEHSLDHNVYEKVKIEEHDLIEDLLIKEDPWEPNVILNSLTGFFEISIVKKSNISGQKIVGVFDGAKILIGQGGVHETEVPRSSLHVDQRWIYNKMLRLSRETADELNCETTTFFPDVEGLKFRQDIQYTGTGNLNYVLPKDFKVHKCYKIDSGSSIFVQRTQNISRGVNIYFFANYDSDLRNRLDVEFVGNWVEITKEEWESSKESK